MQLVEMNAKYDADPVPATMAEVKVEP